MNFLDMYGGVPTGINTMMQTRNNHSGPTRASDTSVTEYTPTQWWATVICGILGFICLIICILFGVGVLPPKPKPKPDEKK